MPYSFDIFIAFRPLHPSPTHARNTWSRPSYITLRKESTFQYKRILTALASAERRLLNRPHLPDTIPPVDGEPPSSTQVQPIQGLKHPAVKEARDLSTAAGRRKHHAFLVEGLKNLQTTLRLDKPLRSVFVSESALAQFPKPTLRQLADLRIPAYSASAGIITKILSTRYEPATECLTVVAMEAVTLERLISNSLKLVLLCDHVVDPRNLGVIIRTADAACADAVILTPGCADPHGRAAVRASTGSILSIPVIQVQAPKVSLRQLRDSGLLILSSSAVEGTPLWDFDLTRPMVLILGNETSGVSPQLRSLADDTLRIPLHGSAHSLNVAVASGVILFERLRQLRTPSP